MSKTLIIQKNILEYLKEELDIPNLNFFEMFLPKEDAIVKQGEENHPYPCLLIRPNKEYKNGVFKRRKFEILIVVHEENDEVGQNTLFSIAEKVTEILEKNSLVSGKFTLDPSSLIGEFSPELCPTDFWGYLITFESDISAPRSEMLKRRGI